MIAHLYKLRWRFELFFKWIKQNLAYETLLRHWRQRRQDAGLDRYLCLRPGGDHPLEFDIDSSLSPILQILSLNAFGQVPLAELIANTQSQDESSYPSNQLLLWGNGRMFVMEQRLRRA